MSPTQLLTHEDKTALAAAAPALASKSRDREATTARNNARDLIARVYTSGVPAPEIADAIGFGREAVHYHLRKARPEGTPAPARARIARATTPKPAKAPTTRDLTPRETSDMQALLRGLPYKGRGRDWQHPNADMLLDFIRKLATDTPAVPVARIADMLGMTRQALTHHINR